MADKDKLKKRKHRRAGRVILIIFLCLVFLCCAFLLAGYLLFRSYYRKTVFETAAEQIVFSSSEAVSASETTESPETAASEEEITVAPEAESSIEEEIAEVLEETAEETVQEKNIYRILLIGVDRRDAGWNGNSDAMILVNINYDDETVTLTSFMRDLGVSIPGYGVRKMNHAFAVGGAPLLLETLSQNFGITADSYAWVDFEGMQSIIDAIGGVELTLTAEEASFAGLSITETQSVHLTGEQALKHMRDRFSGGNDYMRTQRQRNVLLAIVEKMRGAGVSELNDAANAVLPYIHHNMEEGTLLKLLLKLNEIKNFEFKQLRVPFDGLYHNEGEMLIPDFAETVSRLRENLY